MLWIGGPCVGLNTCHSQSILVVPFHIRLQELLTLTNLLLPLSSIVLLQMRNGIGKWHFYPKCFNFRFSVSPNWTCDLTLHVNRKSSGSTGQPLNFGIGLTVLGGTNRHAHRNGWTPKKIEPQSCIMTLTKKNTTMNTFKVII